MTRAQAIAKLTKLFAMMSTMPSNLHEAAVAKKRFDALAKRHQLSVSDLLNADNPDQQLVLSIVRKRQQIARKLRTLSQFAVDEWKRQTKISESWWAAEWARKRAPDEAMDLSRNPARFTEAKRAATEAKTLGDRQFISLTSLGLDEESQQLLIQILNNVASDEESRKDFEDNWI